MTERPMNMIDMTDAWTSEELRHQVGASEHMLRLAQREHDAAPTPERAEGLREAAMWLQKFRDLLSDQLRAERIRQERRAA